MRTTLLLLSLSLQGACDNSPSAEIARARTLYLNGADLLRTGDPAAAESAFRDAARLYEAVGTEAEAAEFAATLNNLGTTLSNRGEHARAVPVLRRALHLAPKSYERTADIAGNLAVVYIALGDFAAAAPLVDQALRLAEDSRSPYQPYALALRGQIRLANKQFESGLADADRALRFDPAPDLAASVHHLRAWLLFGLNRRRECHEAFETALRLDPKPAFAKDYAWVRRRRRP